MKRPPRGLIVVLVMCALAGVARAADAPLVIDEHVTECRHRPVEWKPKGKVELGELLREMSTQLCEGYFLPKLLLHWKIDLILSPVSEASEMRSRLEGLLKAQGFSLDRAHYSELKLIGPPPRHPPATPPPMETIDVRPADCPRTVDWRLTGKTELGEVLRQLSASFCEGYFVPKSLVRQKLELVVVPTSDGHEMQRRVVGALRALGYDLDAVDYFFVKADEAASPP